jgi:hypothetical protein
MSMPTPPTTPFATPRRHKPADTATPIGSSPSAYIACMASKSQAIRGCSTNHWYGKGGLKRRQ